MVSLQTQFPHFLRINLLRRKNCANIISRAWKNKCNVSHPLTTNVDIYLTICNILAHDKTNYGYYTYSWSDRAAFCLAIPSFGIIAVHSIPRYQHPLISVAFALLQKGRKYNCQIVTQERVKRFYMKYGNNADFHDFQFLSKYTHNPFIKRDGINVIEFLKP